MDNDLQTEIVSLLVDRMRNDDERTAFLTSALNGTDSAKFLDMVKYGSSALVFTSLLVDEARRFDGEGSGYPTLVKILTVVRNSRRRNQHPDYNKVITRLKRTAQPQRTRVEQVQHAAPFVLGTSISWFLVIFLALPFGLLITAIAATLLLIVFGVIAVLLQGSVTPAVIGTTTILFLVGGGGAYILNDDGDGIPILPPTPQQVVFESPLTIAPTITTVATEMPTMTDTFTSEPPTATQTPTVTNTFTSEPPTATQTPTVTNTFTSEPPTATQTPTATYTTAPTNTPLPPTPDITETRRVAFATLAAMQTATAAAMPTATQDPLQAAYDRALAFQDIPNATNADWQPFEWAFDDGITMVLVPAGCFEMGSNDGGSDEQPVHTRCFDEPFWIDKYEVSQADFARLGGENSRGSCFDGDNLPEECITWFEARDFCGLRGARLPREDEWEYAARGPDALLYPWGDTFDGVRVNHRDNNGDGSIDGYSRTAPVDAFSQGASWVGAEQLSGNVWEWVSSEYRAYPYDETDGREGNINSTDVRRALRGGSWNSGDTDVRAAIRYRDFPVNSYLNSGFRCSRSF